MKSQLILNHHLMCYLRLIYKMAYLLTEGEVSFSTIMNNLALEVCNNLNLTNERSRDICREKDDTDPYNFQQES